MTAFALNTVAHFSVFSSIFCLQILDAETLNILFYYPIADSRTGDYH